MKGRKTLKNQKGTIAMKKATLETIRTALIDLGYENKEVLDELDVELNKGAAEKAARAEAYEGIHSLIVDNLSDTPVSCADLCLEIAHELASRGMTRYNVQYALNNLWQDEIVKIPGKPNTYRKA
jgi:hypothetical protein